jgi:hypothetical protein
VTKIGNYLERPSSQEPGAASADAGQREHVRNKSTGLATGLISYVQTTSPLGMTQLITVYTLGQVPGFSDQGTQRHLDQLYVLSQMLDVPGSRVRTFNITSAVVATTSTTTTPPEDLLMQVRLDTRIYSSR